MKQQFLNIFGPCGLLCEKCFAYDHGPIHYHAQQLQIHLGSFDVYAQRFEKLLNKPVFKNYPEFKEFLNFLASDNCKGCRNDCCKLFINCKVKECYKKKKIDFCFQCSDFPCAQTGFDNNLQERWLKINERIKEIGIENYYHEIKDKPRY